MTAAPPAVLQVVTDTDRRGAQVFATDLAAALDHLGHEVRTVALAPGKTGGLDLPVLGQTRMGGKTLRALRREMRSAPVVVAHGSTTLPACALASLGLDTPFVYRQISESLFWAPTLSRRLRVAMALRRASRVVALWAGAAEVLQAHFRVPSDRIVVIPNGTPPERFPPVDRGRAPAARASFGLPRERPTVLYAGALVPEKGVDLAIRAIAGLNAQLLVAGDGPERPSLEALAEALAPGRVRFAGSLPDLVDAYDAADVVVLLSRGGDSMPAVLIEAGLRGLPVVASTVEAIVEIVDHGTTGLLVAPGDALAATGALGPLLTQPDRALAMGAAARARCLEHFSIETVARQWSRALIETLERRSRDPAKPTPTAPRRSDPRPGQRHAVPREP